MIAWEHENGVRGVWDITIAPDLYLRSDYYTNDERWEVTGRTGFARVNRCTGRGIQQPSLEIYAEGELRAFHALDDDWASSFRDSGRHWLRWLHTGEARESATDNEPVADGATEIDLDHEAHAVPDPGSSMEGDMVETATCGQGTLRSVQLSGSIRGADTTWSLPVACATRSAMPPVHGRPRRWVTRRSTDH